MHISKQQEIISSINEATHWISQQYLSQQENQSVCVSGTLTLDIF